jgi:hypothetical protein
MEIAMVEMMDSWLDRHSDYLSDLSWVDQWDSTMDASLAEK